MDDRYEKACEIGAGLDSKALSLLSELPSEINKENAYEFVLILGKLDEACCLSYRELKQTNSELLDYGAERMLIPFHHLTYGWQNCYCKDFSWQAFIDDIIDSCNGCAHCQFTNGKYDGIYRIPMRLYIGDSWMVEFGYPD